MKWRMQRRRGASKKVSFEASAFTGDAMNCSRTTRVACVAAESSSELISGSSSDSETK